MSEVQDVAQRVAAGISALPRLVAALSGQPTNPDQFAEIVGKLFPVPEDTGRARVRAENRAAQIARRIVDGEGYDTRTAWGVWQGITEYVDHDAEYRGRNDRRRAENRAQSITWGSGAALKRRALDTIVEVVESDLIAECLEATRNPSLDTILEATQSQNEPPKVNLEDFIP
jgi:hypothetical protein